MFLVVVAVISVDAFFRWPGRDEGGLILLALLSVVAVFFMSACLMVGSHNRAERRAALKTTCYALTDRRVISWRPASSVLGPPVRAASAGAMQIASIPRYAIHDIHRVENPDGTGTIVIRRNDRRRVLDEGGDPIPAIDDTIDGIADVRRVERLFRDVLLGDRVG